MGFCCKDDPHTKEETDQEWQVKKEEQINSMNSIRKGLRQREPVAGRSELQTLQWEIMSEPNLAGPVGSTWEATV